MKHLQHTRVFQHGRSVRLRAFCERHCDFPGNHFAVVRQPGSAQQVVDAEQRPFLFGGFRADQLHLDVEPFGHGGGATQLRHAVARAGHDQAPHLSPADRMSGLAF